MGESTTTTEVSFRTKGQGKPGEGRRLCQCPVKRATNCSRQARERGSQLPPRGSFPGAGEGTN